MSFISPLSCAYADLSIVTFILLHPPSALETTTHPLAKAMSVHITLTERTTSLASYKHPHPREPRDPKPTDNHGPTRHNRHRPPPSSSTPTQSQKYMLSSRFPRQTQGKEVSSSSKRARQSRTTMTILKTSTSAKPRQTARGNAKNSSDSKKLNNVQHPSLVTAAPLLLLPPLTKLRSSSHLPSPVAPLAKPSFASTNLFASSVTPGPRNNAIKPASPSRTPMPSSPGAALGYIILPPSTT